MVGDKMVVVLAARFSTPFPQGSVGKKFPPHFKNTLILPYFVKKNQSNWGRP